MKCFCMVVIVKMFSPFGCVISLFLAAEPCRVHGMCDDLGAGRQLVGVRVAVAADDLDTRAAGARVAQRPQAAGE